MLDRNERVKVPALAVLKDHTRALVLGTVVALATFVVFYLMTVFALSWGTTRLGFSRQAFLTMQLVAVVFFALTIPPSAVLADRHGRRMAMILVSAAIAVFGLLFGPLFGSGTLVSVGAFMVLGMCLIGFTYGPLGTLLAELFPAEVRYTGASLAFVMGTTSCGPACSASSASTFFVVTFTFAGILGASLAPYIATWLATNYGLAWVGYYLTAAALLSLFALLAVGDGHAKPAPQPASR